MTVFCQMNQFSSWIIIELDYKNCTKTGTETIVHLNKHSDWPCSGLKISF